MIYSEMRFFRSDFYFWIYILYWSLYIECKDETVIRESFIFPKNKHDSFLIKTKM